MKTSTDGGVEEEEGGHSRESQRTYSYSTSSSSELDTYSDTDGTYTEEAEEAGGSERRASPLVKSDTLHTTVLNEMKSRGLFQRLNAIGATASGGGGKDNGDAGSGDKGGEVSNEVTGYQKHKKYHKEQRTVTQCL